jgi:tRNA(His) 5'-end guanylyltransferase
MLSICGWLTKQEFVEKRTFYPTGSIAYRSDGTSFERLTDSFEIKNSQLRSFFELLSQKV